LRWSICRCGSRPIQARAARLWAAAVWQL